MAGDTRLRWGPMAAIAGAAIVLLSPAAAAPPKGSNPASNSATSPAPITTCKPDMRSGPVECAEWKSAIAAEGAAKAARESITISRWTLAAAIFAGLIAVIAACLARSSNRIARSVGQAQARCYLSARNALLYINDAGEVTVKVLAHNSGQSPARDLRWTFTVQVQNDHDDWTWEQVAAADLPGSDVYALGEQVLSATLIGDHIMPVVQASALMLEPSVEVRLNVSARWRDVFDIPANDQWSFTATLPGALNRDLALASVPGPIANA